MTPVWHLLVDGLARLSTSKINPVLGGVQDIIIANQLRRGMMDSDIVTVTEEFDPNSESCTGLRDWRLCELPREQRTDNLMQKRQIISARIRGFVMWRRLSYNVYLAQKDFSVDDELYIMREIEKSTREQPSQGLLDYAQAGDIPVSEAFEYLKLYADEQISKRLTLHAIADKVARQLNTCMTGEEVDAVCADMRRMFFGRKAP